MPGHDILSLGNSIVFAGDMRSAQGFVWYPAIRPDMPPNAEMPTAHKSTQPGKSSSFPPSRRAIDPLRHR